MSGWLVDRFKLLRQIKLKLSIICSHQVSAWIHRLNLLLILLIWLHVHLIDDFSEMTSFITTFDAYTYIIIGYYLLAKFITLFKTNGTVIANKQLAPNTQQLVIKLDKNDPAYQAGDFYFVSFRGNQLGGKSILFPLRPPLKITLMKLPLRSKNLGILQKRSHQYKLEQEYI